MSLKLCSAVRAALLMSSFYLLLIDLELNLHQFTKYFVAAQDELINERQISNLSSNFPSIDRNRVPLVQAPSTSGLVTIPILESGTKTQVQLAPFQTASIENNQLLNGAQYNNQFQSNLAHVVGQQQQTVNLPISPIQTPQVGQPSASNTDEPVIQLDYSSINDEVLHQNTANFVYFNANFEQCRNCDKFFSTWKELASDLRWWRPVVKLFSINCSDEDNIDTCRRARVTQFPQVKFFWVSSNSLDVDGQRVRMLGKSVHAMRHLIMDKILESYMENVKLLANQRIKQQQQQPTTNISPSNGQASTSSPLNQFTSFLTGPIGQMILSPSSTGVNPLAPFLQSFLQTQNNKQVSTSSPLNGIQFNGLANNPLSGQSLSQLINLLVGLNARKLAQPLPANWPKLEAIEVPDTHQLLTALPLDESRNFGALLIMETQEFLYTGLEVLLDLSPYSNQTYVARVRDERSQLSKNLTKRDDIIAPALIYVNPKGDSRLLMTAPKYTNDEDLRRAFVRTFERKQVKYPVKRYRASSIQQQQQQQQQQHLANSLTNKLAKEDENIMTKIHSVYLDDLTNTIRASLMEQVYRHSDLSDEQYNALVKYVYVIINYFPFDSDDQLKFFKRLHTWLQNQVSPVDISEYKKQFHDIDEVMPKRDWISCRALSNTKSIPTRLRKGGFLFDKPSQIGKVVSNITRLLRSQQQQATKIKTLFNAFAQNALPPVMLTNNQSSQSSIGVSSNGNTTNNSKFSLSNKANKTNNSYNDNNNSQNDRDDSPIDRIIKSLTSGSLGSNYSILKLISTALTGGAGANGKGEANGKSKFAREYPCGAWKLAHVMVVNEFVKDSPRKDVKHIVLHSLYQYMLQFYACTVCGNRVSDVSTEFRLNLDDHLQEQADSVMLLWKVHNRISKRLENEFRPGSPIKVQFPSEALCPKCRSTNRAGQASNSQAANSLDFVSTPNWHEKQVLNFLVHHYRPQSLLANSNSTSDFSSWTSSWSLSSRSSSNRNAAKTTNLSLSIYCFLLGAIIGRAISYQSMRLDL